jgi:hypothetical protein
VPVVNFVSSPPLGPVRITSAIAVTHSGINETT